LFCCNATNREQKNQEQRHALDHGINHRRDADPPKVALD
jgi:hypothetical protein